MKKTLILLITFLFVGYIQAQNNPKVSYAVKYIFDDEGNVHKSEAYLNFMLGNLSVKRNGQTKNWKYENRGQIKHQDGDLTFLYYYYYLPTINVQMYISKDRIIKHEDTFYYRIIFDGQTQLAL
ncbi:hypothetical protein [Dysgonomonas capnocytophagoides]|uniref:hypothetical protein n=1 Tax=Dysgonomonas capnocytophagoides TaxID=45254 RepID=UPI003994C817